MDLSLCCVHAYAFTRLLCCHEVMHLSTPAFSELAFASSIGYWHYFFFPLGTLSWCISVLYGIDKLGTMIKSGPIIVIDDDLEDQQILDEIFKNLDVPNKIIFFSDGDDALQYLISTEDQPFLILSDINMPRMDGFEVRNRIWKNEKLKTRFIPYLFFTTSVDKKAVYDAYNLSVQGFFIKPTTMVEMQNALKKIIDYWQECYSPGQFN